MTAQKIFVRQVRSSARTKGTHVRTLVAMGLGRIGKSTVLPDNLCVRGMIRSVVQWLEILPVDGQVQKKPSVKTKSSAKSSAKTAVKSKDTEVKANV